MSYQTLRVRFQEPVCFIQFYRPEANNTINELLIEEFWQVLALCEESITIIVLEGLPNVFCFGADFQRIHEKFKGGQNCKHDPGPLYDLWMKWANGPYVTVSHVRGRVNAGGIGFVAASDIVLSDQEALFSLSELLFGLLPACVLPFLIRRIGFQKSHYMILMTKPIPVQLAYAWGLVDAYDNQSESLLRQHLIRLRCLSKTGIIRYKRYMNELNASLNKSKSLAIAANLEVFSDPHNIEKISHYIETGKFPWEN